MGNRSRSSLDLLKVNIGSQLIIKAVSRFSWSQSSCFFLFLFLIGYEVNSSFCYFVSTSTWNEIGHILLLLMFTAIIDH